MTTMQTFDLLVVGGGINGSAIARAASVAGQRVLLVESADLAQATSSASTKLIHGGLRYLETYDFKLVSESLRERAIMLRTAPHLVRPLQFHLPFDASARPWLMVRAGLWLYDFFARGGGLPRSRALRMDDPALRERGGRGFSYWDAAVDDARLVVLNALDAAESGARIQTRTRLFSARREGGMWHALLASMPDGRMQSVSARMLANAAGPWVDRVLREAMGAADVARLRLVRGSHILVPRCFGGEHAYLLQQPDGRIVFAIPYAHGLTLIGTTEVEVERAEDAAISTDEAAYLIAAANRYLQKPIAVGDIVASFAGVRALFDDGADDPNEVSRDYRLDLDVDDGASLLSVFGGKITTARHLASVALARLGVRGGDTRTRPLPGGDFASFAVFLAEARQRWPFLGAERSERMARAYGTRMQALLAGVASAADLGEDFGAGLTAREVDYLVRVEWARSAQDILWRRSKLGLVFDANQVARLDAYLQTTQQRSEAA